MKSMWKCNNGGGSYCDDGDVVLALNNISCSLKLNYVSCLKEYAKKLQKTVAFHSNSCKTGVWIIILSLPTFPPFHYPPFSEISAFVVVNSYYI